MLIPENERDDIRREVERITNSATRGTTEEVLILLGVRATLLVSEQMSEMQRELEHICAHVSRV